MPRLALFLALTLATPLLAQAQAEGDVERIRQVLTQRLTEFTPDAITPSAVPGIYQVLIGSQVIYASADGRYVFQGRLLDIVEGADLTEPAVREVRMALLDKVPESRMVIFEPQGEVRHTLTTFTDVDCTYCRRMHSEMADLNARGIRVRYMLYPRTGVNSPSYQKAVGVWCAEDRQVAMTRAKLGEPVPPKTCENPVQEHMALAVKLGLTGTPFTITDTGEKIAGYAPAERLLKRLEEAKAALAKAP
jgi:thiol:disulfide interchange protein DsbC